MAWILIVSTGLSGCALRRDANAALDPQKAAALQMELDSYHGRHVRLRLNDGERVDGVLVLADADTVSVESTPGAPPRVIARTSIADVSKRGRLAGLPVAGKVLVVTLVVAAAWGAAWVFYWLLGKACESSDGSC